MIESYEEQLDQTKARLVELEKNLLIMQGDIITMTEQIKETQYYIIKLVKNQADITKRLSSWPYIAVPTSKQGEE